MTNIANPRAETLYGFPQPNQRQTPLPIIANRAPTANDVGYPIGQAWIHKNNGGFELVGVSQGVANWQPTSGSQAVDSVSGTTNQITATNSGGAVTLSLPSAVTAPGSLATTTTLVGGTGITATTGNITATNGNLVLSTAGNCIQMKSGTNAKCGIVQLTGGSVIVSNVPLTSNSSVLVTNNGPSGPAGALRVTLNVPGSSMTIDSTSGTDESTVSYFIFERS